MRSDRDGDTENEERKKDTADADEVKKNVTVEKQMPLRNGWNCIWINIRIVEIKRR